MSGQRAPISAAEIREARRVELASAIVGGDDVLLGAAVRGFVREHLSDDVDEWLFARGGAASAHGIRLSGGQRIVVKVHPPGSTEASRLDAAHLVQAHLHENGFPCPRPLLGARPLGHGLAVVESYLDAGEPADPSDPATHEAMARALHDIVEHCRPLTRLGALDAELLGRYPLDPLWPGSHDPNVDFEASAEGAAWIDELAREARRRRYSTAVGRMVIGHNDWRVEHVRLRSGSVAAVFDWDSLVRTREPLLVASALRGFTADWSKSYDPTVPTLEQMRRFLDAYEEQRGARFSAVERTIVYAGWIDALAYAARWEHGRYRHVPEGGFQKQLATDAPELLGLEA